MFKSSRRSLLACLVIFTIIFSSLPNAFATDSSAALATTEQDGVKGADAALAQGRTLLRRNRADQALPLVESALEMYTRANAQNGMAAAQDVAGDIYVQQGQYDTALDLYGRALQIFRTQNDVPNINLLLAKIGETQYLAGDGTAAQATFAQMFDVGEQSKRRGGAGVAFANVSAIVPGLVCPSFNSNNNSSNSSGDMAGNGAGSNEPPNMGRAPKGLDGIGRMDLRIVDQNGNPVQGVKARLATKRPNGISCDCWDNTDLTGRVLLPPIHIGKVLKLELRAKGFEPQDIIVDPAQMAQAYRVVMQAKGAAQAAANGAAQQAQSSANAVSSASAAAACLNLYSLFNSYVTGQFGLGRSRYNDNQLGEARAHYENVLAAADKSAPAGNTAAARLYRVVARTNLGDVAFREGRYADAIKLYTQAAEGARQDNRLELVWSAYRGIGRSYLAQAAQQSSAPQPAVKSREEALKAYRLSLAAIETILDGSLRADEARAHFLATTKDVFDEASGALAEMALMTQPGGVSPNQALAHAASAPPLSGQALAYATEAFKIAEQGRARALLDLLGAARAEISEGVPAQLLERKTANVARQQEIADALTGLQVRGQTPPVQSVAELEAELERLTVEYNSLENQIRTSSPRYAGITRTQPLTLAEVQAQVLDSDTALLAYSLGKERSYLWVVTKDELRLFKLLGRDAIDQQVIALREQIIPSGARRSLIRSEEGIRGINEEVSAMTDERGLQLGGQAAAAQSVRDYENAAHALFETVLAPALPSVGSKRLLVVADGSLNYVPFEALVAKTGGLDYPTLAYLIQTNEVIYAPSASVVAVVRQQQAANRTAAQRGVLLVADPVFQASDARVKGNAGSATDANRSAQSGALKSAIGDLTKQRTPVIKLARLTGTRKEAQQIAELTRTTGGQADLWLDLDASEGNVRQRDLSNYRIVHFATHGLLNAERPQFTGLALTLVGEQQADGFLRVGEVFNLRFGSPLVILSACETGLGKEKRGEGVIGLTRAFMYAGAPTVGVTLWSVADRSTAELMPDLYKRMLTVQNVSPSAALRAAQQQMIAGRKYSAPFYWAPFVLVGDWR
ncbi:hypothetical protein BH18ACI2_BH18ACI2_05410 [soil metagenome]